MRFNDWLGLLFNNPKNLRWLIAAFVAVLLLSFALHARADGLQLGFSGGSTVVRGYTPALGLTVKAPHVVANDYDIDVGFLLIGRSDFSASGQPNQIIAFAQVVGGFSRVDLGIGLATMQNADAYNSGRINFALSVGYRATDRFSVLYRHFSNAGSHAPNLGRDLVLIGYRF